jgi:hypothetical protein
MRSLDEAFGDKFGPARRALAALAPRIQALREAFARPVDEVQPPAAGAASSVADAATPANAPFPPPGPRTGRADLGVSPGYYELVDKLEAFRRLIEKREMIKASVVADDVMHIIDNFDPRTYFPDMFADFSEKLSVHVQELSPHWDERESIAWKAMVQFYRVDLRRFVGS